MGNKSSGWGVLCIAALSVFVFCLAAMAYCIGHRHGRKASATEEASIVYETIKDTVTVTRTVTAPLPVVSYIDRVDTVLIPVDRLVYSVQDSVAIELPVERKDYLVKVDSDSVWGEIRASVSGVSVSLDTLDWRLNVEKVTVKETRRKKWGFNVGPAVGVGYNGRNFGPYVGVGLQWGLNF